MPLNEAEKERVRYHLGYQNVGKLRTVSVGSPHATMPMWILESNMNDLLPAGEPGVRRCIQELDCIEDQLSQTRASLAVRRTAAGVELDGAAAMDALREAYVDWVGKLADTLGAPINPFSMALTRFGAGPGTVIEPG